MSFALLASAIIPSLLLIWYFHSRDVYPEPRKVILATFFLGVLIIIPTLIVATPIAWLLRQAELGPYLLGASEAFLVAAIPEELLKFSVLYLYASRHREFDEPMDGIVYGVVASLGFATLENVLYTASGGMTVAIARSLTAVPAHAFMGAIMGYYVGQARFGRGGDRGGLMFQALFWPMLLHGLYDAPLLIVAQINAGAGIVVEQQVSPAVALLPVTFFALLALAIAALRLTSKLRKEQLSQEQAVVGGVAGTSVTPAQQQGSFAGGCALVVIGGLGASIGGLMMLGVAAGLATGEIEQEQISMVLIGALFIGLLPFAGGLLLFVLGLRKLPKHQRAREV